MSNDATKNLGELGLLTTVSAGVVSISGLATPFTQSGTGAVARTTQDKLRESVSVLDFGADPTGSVDSTAAFNNAISASGAYGGHGVVTIPKGTYNLSAISLSGVLGLTLKGKNGGNIGNLSVGSTGGASVLNFVNTTGDSLNFTCPSYNSANILFEDVAIFANTTGYALSFTPNVGLGKQVSQIYFNRVSLTNSGGTTPTTGNGIRFSATFYVNADKLYVWKTGTLYTVGQGVTIDMGGMSSFLGGEFNFNNCSLYGWQTGLSAGDQSATPTGNQGYANVNYVNSELNSNGQGACFYYGVKAAQVSGCYVEGNLQLGVGVYNQAKNVTIDKCFFNNSTASVGDVQLGQNGSGTTYTQFYNAEIRNNLFTGSKTYGIVTYAGIGSSLNIENNSFTLGTTGCVGINANQSTAGNLSCTSKNNSFYGFALGTGSMAGNFNVQADNYEFNSSGTFIGSWKASSIIYSSFVDFTVIAPTDPDSTVITNSVLSARYINVPPASSRNRKQFITLTAASTQSVRLMKSDATTQLALLTAGKGAIMWNDGTNEYVTLLP